MSPANLTAQWLRASTELRALARRLGIMPYLSNARSVAQRLLGRSSYEAGFDRALMRAIRPGDVVWDVGANVGLYTARFSAAVGPTGRVIAFEPTPACFGALTKATSGLTNVTLLNKALGDITTVATMSIAEDPLGATHSLVAAGIGPTAQVEVVRGDELVAQGLPVPNVIKIDVEGFEEEVLDGLAAVLRSPSCRAVLCEVHFGILDQRGRRQAPARIGARLEGDGYSLSWTDASHFAATRSI
jgi:FkbM family methyltransferase